MSSWSPGTSRLHRWSPGFSRLPFLFLLILLCGCGSNLGTVEGTVMLDGQPVPDGTVTFIKQDDANLAREGAVIKDGKFKASIPPGNYKLELNGQKVIGTRTQKGFDGKDEILDQTAEMFPDKYNKKSTLTQEIKAGVNVVKLELNSMP
jgi:hypothetical protein